MLAFVAVLTLSSCVKRLVNDKKTGIAASGFTTEKSEVKLASKSANAPKNHVLLSGFNSDTNSNIASKIDTFK